MTTPVSSSTSAAPVDPVTKDGLSSSDSGKWIEQLEDADFWTKVLAYFQRMQNLQKSSVQITLKGMEADQIISRDAKQMQASVESISNAMKADEKKSVTAGAMDMLRKYEQPIIDPDTNKKMSVDDFLAKVAGDQAKKVWSDVTEIRYSDITYRTEADKVKNDSIWDHDYRVLKAAHDDPEFYNQCSEAEKKEMDHASSVNWDHWHHHSDEYKSIINPLGLRYQMVKYNRIIDEFAKDHDIAKMTIAIDHFKDGDQAYNYKMPLDKAKEFIKTETDRQLNIKPDLEKNGPEFNKAQFQAIVSALNSLSDAKSTSSQQKNQSVQSTLGEIQALITQITNTINAKNEAKKGIASNTGR
ncbi:hypothetical protein [Aeromonas jandaei]|uniref:hypothetical protein n=1 Tax=Aeromonas jandaei TaxID=650 RepID=UPI003BA07CB9